MQPEIIRHRIQTQQTMKSNIEIADQAVRLMNNVIKNELPTESCPEKRQHILWKREEVRQLIISKLQTPAVNQIGPTMIKSTDE